MALGFHLFEKSILEHLGFRNLLSEGRGKEFVRVGTSRRAFKSLMDGTFSTSIRGGISKLCLVSPAVRGQNKACAKSGGQKNNAKRIKK